jgi:hypothetical protein
MTDAPKKRLRPHGTQGVIRRWILRTAADRGGITTAEVQAEFTLPCKVAAGHLRTIRDLGYLEAEREAISVQGALRSSITASGRDYLARSEAAMPKQYDAEPLAQLTRSWGTTAPYDWMERVR